MLDWIIEGIRFLVWGITSAGLSLMDTCYELISKIATADFLMDDIVWQWYYTFMLFLGLLIIARSLSVFLKFAFDEEFREKISGSYFMNKLVTIVLVIALLPTCLGFISQLSAWGIKNMSMFLGTQSSDKPSTMIITAFMNTENGEFNEQGKWISGEKVTYTIDEIDINAEGEGDDAYKFFNEVSDLFIIFFIGISASIMLIINGVQIGKRMYSLVMKVGIAPIPISSLIVPGDDTFSMWRKMIISDYLLNYVQTIMIMIIMILCGSKLIQSMGMWVQIISFIAGLLLLLSGIPELARIVGGDTSQGNVLQQLASFRMATRGMGHGIAALAGGAIGAAASGAKGLGAMATYGAGRLMGGKSINDMNKMNPPGGGADGFMGGSKFNDNQNKGFSGLTTGGTAGNGKPKAFGEEATDKQKAAGEKLKIPGMDNMSKGEASLALEAAGANKSFWSEQGANNVNSVSPGSNGNDYATIQDNASLGTSINTGENIPGSEPSPKESLSNPGSVAQKMSNVANETPGFRGGVAKLATNASSHLYQKSAQRISQTKVYRSGQNAKRTFNDLKGVYKGDDISGSSKF